MRPESSLPAAIRGPASPAGAIAPKDSLGCLAHQLQRDQELGTSAGMRIFRKTSGAVEAHRVETAPSARGALLGISLSDGHRRRVQHEHHASSHDFGKGSIYLRDFGDRYRADILSPFDFVLLEISPPALERAMDEREGRRATQLVPTAGRQDDVLANLAWALTAALDRPAEASPLFVDQLGLAMSGYLVDHYSGERPVQRRERRLLSRLHEARAKEMLRSRMDGGVPVTEIADACNLSRSYFIHAFRETTGQTPHQWLTSQRLERARALLLESEQPLADVAAACGFADQSHFTRVFSQSSGLPPGSWRRKMRAGG